MCFESKAKVLQKIKKKIALPPVWMQKTDDTVLIKYYLEGQMMFLTIDRSTVATILQQFGLIKRYEGSGESLRMYGFSEPICENSSFTSNWSEARVECSQIKIFESDAIHFIACEEYEKILALMQRTTSVRRSIGIEYSRAI